jgi:serine/threonine protein kinase
LQAECDYWSLGVVAYEMVFGQTPFCADRLTETYCNIVNYKSTLKFPDDSGVSQSYCDIVRALLDDATSRLGHEQLLKHPYFATVDWNTLREG